MAKRIMRELKINEISSVTTPAQKGARALIMKSGEVDDSAYEKLCKRTFSAEERRSAAASGAAMPGGRYPIENGSDLENALHAIGRGKGSHAAIRAHIMSRARSLGLTDKIPDDWKASKRDLSRIRNGLREANFDLEPLELSKFAERIGEDAMSGAPAEASLFGNADDADNVELLDKMYGALCVSVESIFSDADAVNKSDLLQATFQQFKDALQGVASGGVENTITRALAEGDNGGSMSKAIAKALGLAETATEAEILAAVEKKGATAEVKELTEKLEKAEALNKLSGKHKAFMESDKAKMPKGGKDAFVAMSGAERDAHMSAHPLDAEDAGDNSSDEATEKLLKSGDAFRSVKGKLYLKSKLGVEVFTALKDQDDDLRKSNERSEKLEKASREAAFAKTAEKFEKVGKPEELGALLAKTAAHEPALADAWAVVLGVAEERIAKGGLLTERGSSVRGFAKAFEAINAKAKDLMKTDPKVYKSIEVARVEVRKREPDLATQEQEELKAAKAAA